MMLYTFIPRTTNFRVTEILRRADDISLEFGGLLREAVGYRSTGFAVRIILEELGYSCKGTAWHGCRIQWCGAEAGILNAQNGHWDIALLQPLQGPHNKQQLVNIVGERLPVVQDEMHYADVRKVILWADSLVQAKPTKLRALNSCPSGRKTEDFLRAVACALDIDIEIWEVK